MPANKRQHYVPKFTLRRFASDRHCTGERRQINILNIDRAKIIRGASLKEQCYRDYFYGHNTNVEKTLSQLEGVFDSVIERMIVGERIDLRDGMLLVQMLSLQKARTLRAADEISGMAQTLARILLQRRFSEEILRNTRFELENTASAIIGMSLRLCPILLDLKPFLLINKSTTPFILADNPVVSTN